MGYLDLSQLLYFFNNWVGFQGFIFRVLRVWGWWSFSFDVFLCYISVRDPISAFLFPLSLSLSFHLKVLSDFIFLGDFGESHFIFLLEGPFQLSFMEFILLVLIWVLLLVMRNCLGNYFQWLDCNASYNQLCQCFVVFHIGKVGRRKWAISKS